jgi:hypothetical protein
MAERLYSIFATDAKERGICATIQPISGQAPETGVSDFGPNVRPIREVVASTVGLTPRRPPFILGRAFIMLDWGWARESHGRKTSISCWESSRSSAAEVSPEEDQQIQQVKGWA